MQPSPAPEVIRVRGISNREFLEQFAGVGRIGLSGGRALVDMAIARAQRHLDDARRWSRWSHAFVLEGRRADGHHWLIESDIQFHLKHIQLGVQENRLGKYHDETLYTSLAIVDVDLGPQQETALLREGLEMVAARTGYSIGELCGTLLALRNPRLRSRENVLAREHAIFCSAFVNHVFRRAGIDLAPGVEAKNTTPEDLARSPAARTVYVLEREQEQPALQRIERRLRVAKRALREARRKLG